jgi:16S rRNA C967 or C1407 C5-methylase (RsmB/RsmF family)
MQRQLGNEANKFFNVLAQPAPVSIRVNPFKEQTTDIRPKMQDRASTADYGLRTTDSVPWCDDGFYLTERPQFIYDPLFHAGCYYVQEASSMFAGTVASVLLKDVTNPLVLDAAAAPGGKSTHLLSVLNKRGFLVSNEVVSQRNSVLQENIWKWGVSNQCITQQQLFEFAQADETFDLILLDAPCSGEGLFRRDPAACNEWSVQSVEGCSLRQRQLIQDVLPSLNTGGYLIYSTCTYAEHENDDNVEHALRNFPLEKVSIDVPIGVVPTKHGYQFYPHRVRGEGFYIAVLRKIGHLEINQSTKRFKPKQQLQRAITIDKTFSTGNDDIHATLGNITSAIPTHADHLLERLSACNLRSIGTPLYETVNGRNVPHIALALHTGFSFHQAIDVDRDTALSYLYGDALVNDSDIRQGYASLRHAGRTLGWVKAAGNRFNNLYPHPWRIRKRA